MLDKISYDDFQMALDLSNSEYVLLKSIDQNGEVVGEVNGELHTMLFAEDGSMKIGQGKQLKNLPENVALALFCLKLLAQKKLTSKIKKIFLSAPIWLDKNFKLSLQILDGHNSNQQGLSSIENLQSYWALIEMGNFSKNKIPSDILAKHILTIYRGDSWNMQCAAMETLMSRIKSAHSEELGVAKRPPRGDIFGYYKVKRKGDGVLDYDILLSSNRGLSVSCSCKDYQKNTLNFCKHTAIVLEHWFFNAKRAKKFQKQLLDDGKIHIRWIPEKGTRQIFNPLDGLYLSIPKKCKSKIKSFEKFFDCNFKLKHDYKSASEKASFLWKFKKTLEKNREKIWVDPVIFPLLEKEIDKLNWPIVFEKNKTQLFAVIKELNIKLYPYQINGVKRALENGKLLLGDDMGLGKTIQAITWAECLLKTKIAKKIIVISPSALKGQWKREWHLVSGRNIAVVDGNLQERQNIYLGKSNVIIMNYELLLRDLEIVQQLNADAIILDEAQRIKNYSSQTARCVKQLHPKLRLVLTGTPMENRISELASLMDWIDDHALAPSWRFDSEFNIDKDENERGPKGVRGLNLLREKISPHFLRRTRGLVLSELPSRTDSVRFIPFTEEQKEIHDEYAAKVARLMAIAGKRPLRPEEHLRLMTSLTHMRVVSNALAQYHYNGIWESLKKDDNPEARISRLSSPKLAEFRSLIEGLLSQENVKIVIFSQWQRMLRLSHWAIRDILDEQEAEAVFFTGREKQAFRNQNIIRFHDDPKVRLFFASDAGGVGLNLQKAATVCINLELPWNPAVVEQRIARIHRLGQKKPIQVYNLVTQGSIEERITNLVGQKKAVFNTLFDGTNDQVIFDENSGFYSQVNEIVQLPIEGHSKKVVDSEEDNSENLKLEQELEQELSEVDEMDINDSDEKDELVPTLIETPVLISTPTPSPTPTKNENNIFAAFNNMKVERKTDGTIKIEASQESAELLAMVFKNMSKMFMDVASITGP